MTVVNAALVDPDAANVPRANALFPEMAISVFELELWLIRQHGRLPPHPIPDPTLTLPLPLPLL
jgi:hypothetical protein